MTSSSPSAPPPVGLKPGDAAAAQATSAANADGLAALIAGSVTGGLVVLGLACFCLRHRRKRRALVRSRLDNATGTVRTELPAAHALPKAQVKQTGDPASTGMEVQAVPSATEALRPS